MQRRSRQVEEGDALHCVEDGMIVAIGTPAPMGLLRQLIRRRVKNLTVLDFGVSLDLLVAAGCVRRVINYYAGGGFGVAVGPSFRRSAEHGQLSVVECEEGILTAGLQAAAQNLPFLPWRGGVGTSLPDVNPDLKVFVDPISGQTLLAVPPIKPDVALLHAACADIYGNVQHTGGVGWLDPFLFRAADRTIVQVERIIQNEAIRADPAATTMVAVDTIVRAPYGAHPFYSRGFYLQDEAHLSNYLRAATHAAAGAPVDLERYLRHYCYEPTGLGDYLERIGVKRLIDLHE